MVFVGIIEIRGLKKKNSENVKKKDGRNCKGIGSKTEECTFIISKK